MPFLHEQSRNRGLHHSGLSHDPCVVPIAGKLHFVPHEGQRVAGRMNVALGPQEADVIPLLTVEDRYVVVANAPAKG